MKSKEFSLEFMVVNDPELDDSLAQEVWLNNQLLMDLRYINGEWAVTFFTINPYHKLPLAYLTEIQRRFNGFVREQSEVKKYQLVAV